MAINRLLKDCSIRKRVLIILLLGLALVACNNLTEPRLEEAKVDRIVSLSPGSTEILFALDLGNELVGVTDFCDYPEEAEGKEKIGGFSDPNLEKIVELEPDLIVHSGKLDGKSKASLESLGIKVFEGQDETIDSILDTILEIGRMTNREDKSRELVDSMVLRRKLIQDSLEGLEPVKVFYEIWNDPLQTAGYNSFIDSLLEEAGGDNIGRLIEDLENPYPNFDLELLIEENPEVYLSSDDGMKTIDEIKNRLGYDNIEAIREDRVYLLEPNMVSRPGPRIIDALEIIAQYLHPEVF